MDDCPDNSCELYSGVEKKQLAWSQGVKIIWKWRSIWSTTGLWWRALLTKVNTLNRCGKPWICRGLWLSLCGELVFFLSQSDTLVSSFEKAGQPEQERGTSTAKEPQRARTAQLPPSNSRPTDRSSRQISAHQKHLILRYAELNLSSRLSPCGEQYGTSLLRKGKKGKERKKTRAGLSFVSEALVCNSK